MIVRGWFAQLGRGSQLPRRTIRLRLTGLYGLLFVASGAGLLAITYALVDHAAGGFLFYTSPNGSVSGAFNATHPAGGQSGNAPNLSANGAQSLLTPQQAQAQAHQLHTLAMRQHSHEMHQLLAYSGIALAIMVVVSVLLGWFIAGRVLRPLRIITTTARQISATSLNRRLALEGPRDELKELGDTFDELLDRLESFVLAQRQFVANASHELRTPLALQRTLIQVALADPEPTIESLRIAHERVLSSGSEQQRLIDALLTLARGQAGLDKEDAIDLAALTHQVVASRRAEATERELHIAADLAVAPITGDARLAERLVTNLIDNALHYNITGGRVGIATYTESESTFFTISNSGPTVPPEAVARLRQPFQQLRTDRIGENHGLGLSIVQAIATAHHADLDIRPGDTGGLVVTVRFHNTGPVSAAPTSRGGFVLTA
jgi:signal transduction histidine kinase